MSKQFLFLLGIAFFFISCGSQKIKRQETLYSKRGLKNFEVESINDSLKIVDSNFLLKNRVGNWEMFVSGSPSEIGTKMGLLTQNLYHFQEKALFNKVETVIPNTKKQKYLFKFLEFYNRNISNHIKDEYREEIYHLSKFATDDYDFLTDKYKRCMFLHGAHDIGHAFQDLMLVGCSSFAIRNDKTADRNLLVGRNFDFYVNDDFAKNKIIAFVKPTEGYPFMSITWAGMVGVTSGMNLEGLTITLNAAKSSIPYQSKTPISLIAREILQYAKNIEEAIAIAKKRQVFVSESLLIASGSENKAVIIEMAPELFSVYEQPNADEIICSNHFQSNVYANDPRNNDQIKNSHSQYRWDKMNQVLKENSKLQVEDVVAVLRDVKGLNNKSIGLGNEKSLNQLYAHHSVVFKPKEKLVWVSSNPNQLAEFTAYDLDEIFNEERLFANKSLMIDSLAVSKDEFIDSKEYLNFQKFKTIDLSFDEKLRNEEWISDQDIENYIHLNPNFWGVYFKAGKYYYQKEAFEKARQYFQQALSKEVSTRNDEETLNQYLKEIRKKIK